MAMTVLILRRNGNFGIFKFYAPEVAVYFPIKLCYAKALVGRQVHKFFYRDRMTRP